MKKTLALLLTLIMTLSLVACGDGEASQIQGDSNNDGQIEVGTEDNVEVNVSDEHLNAAEASASGK